MHECQCLRKPGTGITSPGTGVEVVCQLPEVGVLEESQELLPTETSMSPQNKTPFCFVFKRLEIGGFIRNDFCSSVPFWIRY